VSVFQLTAGCDRYHFILALTGKKSKYRSVVGEPPNRNVIPGDAKLKRKMPPSRLLLPSARRQEERAAMAKGTVEIVVERCKACGFCVEFCPTHVLALSSAFNSKGYHTPYMTHPEKCSGCDLCGMYCPDFAIFGYKLPSPAKESTATAPPATADVAKEDQDAR
jgi:2-oxoglutarate ferredoxin oxidoreductase subunit delta